MVKRFLIRCSGKATVPLSIFIFLSLTTLVVPFMAFCEEASSGQPEQANDEQQIAPPVHENRSFPALSKTSLLRFQLVKKPGFGGRIAFSSRVESYERIFLVDLDTDRVKTLIDGPGNNSFPQWSPDGTKIAFVSDRSGDQEIYIADWEGKNVTRITNRRGVDGSPSWSGDGKNIFLYAEEQGNKQTNIYRVRVPRLNTTAESPVKVTALEGRNTTPAIAPNGKLLAYSTNRFWPGWDICTWNIQRKIENCLVTGKESFCRPAWSPSSQKFLFSEGTGRQIDIGILDMKTRDRYLLTDLELREYDAIFAPDEKNILFVAENGKEDVFNLYHMSLEPRDSPVNLLVQSRYSIRYPSYSGRHTMELEALRIKAQSTARQILGDGE